MNLAPVPVQKFFTNNGDPAVGYQLFSYVSGTSTKIATYKNSAGTLNTNPIVLDFRGECRLWIDPTLSYTFVLAPANDTDPPTNPTWTVDDITAGPAQQDNAADDTGAVNNIELSIPQISSPVAFTRIVFKAANTNTGPVTISINGGTAKDLTWQTLDLMGGSEIQAGGIYEAIFDGSQWQLQGPTLDPSLMITAFETGASGNPTRLTYGTNVYDIRRFGAVGDGVTNDSPAIQLAINCCRFFGGTIIVPMPSAYWRLEDPLDCTTDAGQVPSARGFKIRGDASVLAVTTNSPYFPALIAVHTGHVFDCAGSYGIDFEDLNVGTLNKDLIPAAPVPKTCWFLARSTDNNSSIFRLTNCRVIGHFTEDVYYNYGSEDDILVGCQMYNFSNASGASVVTFTQRNIKNLSSTFIAIATGPQSCIDHYVNGGQYMIQSSTAGADVFTLEGANSTKIIGIWARAALDGSGNGRSIVHVDMTNGPTNNVTLIGITGEHATNVQDYGIVFDNQAHTCSYWLIESCTFPNGGAMIAAGSNASLDNFHIKALSNQSIGGGIDIDGTLQNSCIEEYANNISINVSQSNVLSVSVANLTVTTRINDFWIDSSGGAKTWTPDTTNLTVVGGITVSSVRALFHGNMVTVSANFNAGTSITCAAGTVMAGLPAAAVVRTASVIVSNQNTPALIGVGRIDGSTIILPAIAVGTESVCITATYFAA